MADRVMPLLKEYWPILAVVAAGLIAWGGTQVRLQGIEDDIDEIKSGGAMEARQWKKIAENSDALSVHERRLNDISQYFTPENVQLWGNIRGIVLEDHETLREHLRGHGQ